MSFASSEHQEKLENAVKILEFPTFTAKAAEVIGKPAELALTALPAPISNKIGQFTQACLHTAFRVVLLTVNKKKRFKKAQNIIHKGLVTATGATGGFFGAPALAAELTASTAIMMRSIAEIAREKGEDLTAIEPRLACISVLGLDASSTVKGTDDTNASKYFAIKKAMASEIAKATEYYAANAVSEETPPVVVKLLNKIAERFGIQLTEKIAAEWIPVFGAVTGGSINLLFISHFQRIAEGHFTVRQLERMYGKQRTQMEYEGVLSRLKGQPITETYDEVAVTSED